MRKATIDRRALLRRAGMLATVAATVSAVPALAATGDDRALIDAEAEITHLYQWLAANRDADEETVCEPIYERIYALENIIADTPATSLSDVAVKLRRRLDRQVGIDLDHDPNDVPALLSVLAFIHGIVGEPTHPTRPIYTSEDLEG